MEAIFCGYCGKKNSSDYSFCIKCGKELERQEDESRPQKENSTNAISPQDLSNPNSKKIPASSTSNEELNIAPTHVTIKEPISGKTKKIKEDEAIEGEEASGEEEEDDSWKTKDTKPSDSVEKGIQPIPASTYGTTASPKVDFKDAVENTNTDKKDFRKTAEHTKYMKIQGEILLEDGANESKKPLKSDIEDAVMAGIVWPLIFPVTILCLIILFNILGSIFKGN